MILYNYINQFFFREKHVQDRFKVCILNISFVFNSTKKMFKIKLHHLKDSYDDRKIFFSRSFFSEI